MFKKNIYTFTAIAAVVMTFNSVQFSNAKADLQTTTEESSTLKNVVPDSTITASIKTKYLTDDKIKVLDVRVETVNGKVTLTGNVPDSDVKERAISIATNTSGVKEVVSKLEIKQ